MFVLSSSCAVLHSFPTPEAVPGGYAILSHVWDDSEETFEDVQRIEKECEGSRDNPRDHVSHKIRECCILAEKHGYQWIWNDTCCIDKRSSTELSEAINSMFRYYSLAKVCYAYLRDVLSHDDPHLARSEFRRSRWHQRGWTLQELIAPEWLIFVTEDWRPLGGRTELADVLEEITRIPAPLLRLETKAYDYSVAQRMSWAAQRETTRVEDRAYSLMGVFGIHMPTLYGEGKNAFRRLQEEIMRQLIDPSLFLWGHILSVTIDSNMRHNFEDVRSYLLATSPDEFRGCSDVVFRPLDTTGVTGSYIEKLRLAFSGSEATTASSTATMATLSKRLPTFAHTPYGVHAHVPVVQGANGALAAIIPCFQQNWRPLGLLLSPSTHHSDPSRPLYHVGVYSPGGEYYRTFAIRDIRSIPSRYRYRWYKPWAVTIQWKEIYIALWPPLQQAWSPQRTLPLNTMFSPPFRISEASMSNIHRSGYRTHTVFPTLRRMWTTAPHIAVVFQQWPVRTDEFMTIFLGRCGSHFEDTGGGEPGEPRPHWAAITFYSRDHTSVGPNFPGHACPDDHIYLWPNRTKRVEDPYFTTPLWLLDWLLSFTSCEINPETTLVANLECVITRKYPPSAHSEPEIGDVLAAPLSP